MDQEGTRSSQIRLWWVLAAWILTVAWAWMFFFYPESWRSEVSFEDPQLGWVIFLSVVHVPLGARLIQLARHGVIRFRLGLAVLLVPVAHLLGSPFDINPDWPLFSAFFILPSVAIVILGALELCK